MTSLTDLLQANAYESTLEHCTGCDNRCLVKAFKFHNGNTYYSGNNCEKVYSNRSENTEKGVNMLAEKYRMLFARAPRHVFDRPPLLKLGIPRGLGIYENYPFWYTLFTACNIEVVLSGPSSYRQYEGGVNTIMADNICFPAKLMHGHVRNLVEKGVDRIFYPYVVYERKEDERSKNSFNCPVVSGYSDVLKSSMDTAGKFGVPFDAPVVTFNDEELLYKSCRAYLTGLGVKKSVALQAIAEAIEAQNSYLQQLTSRAGDILDKARREGRMVILLAARPYHTDPLIEHKISWAIADMGIDVITENVSTHSGSGVYDELNAVSQWAYPNRIFKAAHFVGNYDGGNLQMVELTSFGCGPDAFILDEVGAILRRYGKNLTVLKIDDVNNIGSLRLRVRSLVESCKVAPAAPAGKQEYVTTRIFDIDDRRRTLLAPYFAEGYSELIPALFKCVGYRVVNLPMGSQDDAETGLKFANNDICYPATIVVGSIMNALQSGRYNRDEVAVIITQTGGQCRATNYYALIKNAMVSAGYADIPVVSLATGSGVSNQQPGFQVGYKKMASVILNAILFADCLNKLYFSARVREKKAGEALRLRNRFLDEVIPYIEAGQVKRLPGVMESAVAAFSDAIVNEPRPVIGLVGEIYVKYNSFSHKNVVNWLLDNQIEVVPPSLANFFSTSFVANHVNRNLNIRKETTPVWITDTIYLYIRHVMRKYDRICAAYPFYRRFTNIFDDARLASRILSLAADFGEGWDLPGEICSLAGQGVENVISLQPFGCIANHIISKGVEKRIKQVFPQMNLLFLDFDSSTSEANVYNRLHFMVENCHNQLKNAE
ncbi:MAG: 2-hydroxyacyl-CoA dehydratase [Paludibacteraceae bacterium]|nr:2-hydroxyacyl-CoA dehydratase [Paludibacteraceae bacterium]